ncbi:MAG: glycosyltransferase family 9 protein [Gemmatimonadetes bacterium]|nr:glycosyltransferase family 9 protein [Gemmatimonadota bacterium]
MSERGPVRRALKRMRMAVKVPGMRVASWAASVPLDRRARTPASLDAHPPRRILVIRCDRIGDLLCCSPLVAALRRKWPDAAMTLVGGPKNRAVMPLLPYLGRGPDFRRDPLAWSRLAAWLPRQGFDLAVSLRAEVMSGVLIAAASGAPVRMATHASRRTAPAFNLILDSDDPHQLRRYWLAAKQLGVEFPEQRPVIELPPEADRKGAEVVRALAVPEAAPLVGVAIPYRADQRHRIKAWTADALRGVVRALVAEGARVVLFAAGVERLEAEAVRAAVPEARVIPPLSLVHAAGVQRRLDLWVSTPTGLLHLADGVGTPTVTVGKDRFVQGWGPLGDRHRAVWARDARDITPESVLIAARELLARERVGARRRV